MSTATTLCPEQFAWILIFLSKIFSSIYCTGKAELSTASKRCPEQFACIFIFPSKIFSSLSIFLNITRAKKRVEWQLRGALNSLRTFLFFCRKKFSSISRFLKVTRAKVRCQRKLRGTQNCMRVFLFLCHQFLLQYHDFRDGLGGAELSTVTTQCPEQFASILIFLQYLNFWMSHGQRSDVNGNYAEARTVCEYFYFSSISLFLKVARSKESSQWQLRGFLKSSRFLIFLTSNFFFTLSHGQGRGVNGYYAVPRKVCQHFYFFLSKFFFSISQFLNCRTSKAQLTTATRLSPKQFSSIFIFLSKTFFLQSDAG